MPIVAHENLGKRRCCLCGKRLNRTYYKVLGLKGYYCRKCAIGLCKAEDKRISSSMRERK